LRNASLTKASFAGLGFYASPPVVGFDVLTAMGWDDQDYLKTTVEALIAEFGRENLLLMGH
jgi:hypothetical protein